ncbi:MAG: cell division protein FtsZ [Bacteroidales bacterium]|jgi:cell division protein FtsZ|nr:cell division protein FtsZ [Bacteroidales bacterium]HHV40491.1 cell division protein FtsZ [Bacteroidales bacterium]
MTHKEDEFIPLNWENNSSIIKVIGVGGGGGNAVSHMYRLGLADVDFIICNTDAQALEMSPVPEKLQLGSLLTGGRGAGCNPEIAKKAALESEERIRALLEGVTEMVFITAGMGGGTGTGAAPVIARIAQNMGLLTVGVVTLPFRDEGKDFLERALDGIEEMRQHADSMLIIDNEKLYKVYGDLPIFEAFQRTDDILNTAVKSISEIITQPGFMNVDFADVKMVMKDSGMALMGTGSGAGENRAAEAVKNAFDSPLLDDADLTRSKNVLINITSGKEKALSMTELSRIMQYISDYTGGASNFKRGIVCDPSLQDEVRVTVIATGFSLHSLPPIAVYSENKGNKTVEKEVVFLDDLSQEEDSSTAMEHDVSVEDQEGFDNDIHITRKPSVFTVDATFETSTQTTPLKGKPVLIVEPGQDITELEQIPAYKRKEGYGSSSFGTDIVSPSKHTIEEKDGQQRLGTDNSFIHQTQD